LFSWRFLAASHGEVPAMRAGMMRADEKSIRPEIAGAAAFTFRSAFPIKPMMSALALPALHASHAGTWMRSADGPTRAIGKGEAIMAAADTPLILLNAPLVATRLGYPDLSGLDLLELFAFVHPARFVVPTPKGLAHALGLPEPAGDDGVPALLQAAAGALLETCQSEAWSEREGAWGALQSLLRLRWPWAPLIIPHVARPECAEKWLFSKLPEWEEAPERPQPA